MDRARSATAAFIVNNYPLTINRTGNGAGSISTAGVTSTEPQTTATYQYGTSVPLTATPTTGSTFLGWSGGGCSGTGTCTVKMTAAKSVTATFGLKSYPLYVMSLGNGTGDISANGLSCEGTLCSGNYNYGTTVTMTASGRSGASFIGWSGGGCSGTGPCTTVIAGMTKVSANFALPDTTPPNAPLVTGKTPTNNKKPTWSWASGGNGNGIFRYKLDNSGLATGATETTAATSTRLTASSPGSHTLYVQERDEAGNWSASGSFAIVIDTTRPDAPQVSGTSPTNNTKPTWTWTHGVNGGNGTYRYKINSTDFSTGATVTTATSFKPTTALGQGTQTLNVQERDEAGNWSAIGRKTILINTTLLPPAAPTNVTAVYGASVSLTWTDAANNEAGYRIYRKKNNAATYTKIGETGPNLKGYVDSTTVANATYSYYLAAYNGAGATKSTPITIITVDIHAPDQVIAKVAATGLKVDLTWHDNSTSEDNSKIWRTKQGEDTWTRVATLGPDALTYSNTSLTPRLMYTYIICAVGLGGANECSSPVTVNGPTSLKAVKGSTGVDLTWMDKSDDETGFRVYRRKSTEITSTEISNLGPDTVAYTDTTAAEDTTYFYAVEAYNSVGSASSPNEAMITTGTVIPPDAFKAVVAPRGIQAKLTWADKSGIETGFEVWRREQGDSDWTMVQSVAADGMTTIDPGLSIGVLYSYQVCAARPTGGSACSLETGVNGPTALTVSPTPGIGVALTWSDNASDETGFMVYRRKGTAAAMTAIATIDEDGTTYTDTTAKAGTTYYYQVCAFNGGIDSCSVAKKVVMP
jgi:titin